MCGIAVVAGLIPKSEPIVQHMMASLAHRGPDGSGLASFNGGRVVLGHTRLAVIDLSDRSAQPMTDHHGRFTVVYNGEIYNYRELRRQLDSSYSFTTESDTEVILAAIQTWGFDALNRFIGMFSIVLWDDHTQTLTCVRDRFGVKPLYVARTTEGQLLIASEIKAIHSVSQGRFFDDSTWLRYLNGETYDHSVSTFWAGITRVPAGSILQWNPRTGFHEETWYEPDLSEDTRSEVEVNFELKDLLVDAVSLRLRSDVSTGFCLSGGLDSSLSISLSTMSSEKGPTDLLAFTFYTSDEKYDERSWSKKVADRLGIQQVSCELHAPDVPRLAMEMAMAQDEPYGGLPTLGMGEIFKRAKDMGVVVLLDGNGLDESWGGYDYYLNPEEWDPSVAPVQNSRGNRPSNANDPSALDHKGRITPTIESQVLRDMQLHDLRVAKIPRAMRFADRASMMFGRELREPFLDHRLVELGLKQRSDRKISCPGGKRMIRDIADSLLPSEVVRTPKRPVQTPQREWFGGTLSSWAGDCVESCIRHYGDSLVDPLTLGSAWNNRETTLRGSSYWLWTAISLAMFHELRLQNLNVPASFQNPALQLRQK